MEAIRSGSNVGLPEGHWMHKALEKEKARLAKKKAPAGGSVGGLPSGALASLADKPNNQGAYNG